jgi:membrane associated rhomboid family serine protease
LLILNALVFAAAFFVPNMGNRMFGWFALWYPGNEHFGLWQLVTYMFMHGGIAHIFFNMFALVSFGLPLEQQWGGRRFLIFYFLCGIGAGIIHLGIGWGEFQSMQRRLSEAGVTPSAIEDMLNTGRYSGPAATRAAVTEMYRIFATPTVGASGAIYGILVAFGLLFPNAKLALLFLPVPIAAKYFIPALLALDLFSGVTGFSLFGGGVAHFAHIGGAIIGFLLMWHWRNRARRVGRVGEVEWRHG